MHTRRLSGSLFLLGNVLCWGAVPVLLRYLTHSIDGWTANGVRYPMSAMLYWPLLLASWYRGRLTWQLVLCCLIPAILALGGQVCWGLAPYYLPANAVGFFVRLSMLWSVLGAMLIFQDERRLLGSPRFYLGMLLLVAGFLLLASSKFRYDAAVTPLGIGIILTCGCCFGLYGVSVRYFLSGVHPLLAFGVVSQFVSLGTISAMLAWGDVRLLPQLSLRVALLLAFSSVIGVALGHSFFYASLKRLGAAITSGGQTATPIVTTILAVIVLGEQMRPVEWVSGGVMIAGVAVLLATERQVVDR